MKRIFALVFILSISSCSRNEYVTLTDCAKNCELKPDSGPCEAYIPRYYYDKVEGKCKEFIYGGCAGVVPFETLEKCKTCGCE